jgi:outer membrane immunogenic protein
MTLTKTMLAFAASSALIASVGSANAADPVYTMAPTAPAMDWTGFWLGAQVGYMFGDVDIVSAPGGSFDTDGFYLAASAGFDYQFSNNVVLGGFVTAPVASFADGSTPVGVGFNAEVQWAAVAGVRLGYAMDRFLPYVLAGVVVGEGEGVSTTNVKASQTHTGFTVGAGLDYRIDENWTVGAYYAYTDMSDETYQFVAPARIGFDTHAVALTVGYRF